MSRGRCGWGMWHVWGSHTGHWWGKRAGNRTLVRPGHRQKDNIKINLQEI